MENLDRLMRILICGVYFEPINKPNVPLNKDLCNFLLREGNEVELLAIGDRSEHYGFRLIRVKPAFTKETGVWKKAWNYFAASVVSIFRVLIAKYDCVIVYSTPPFLSSWLSIAAKIRSTKVIYDIQDLYPEVLTTGGFLKKKSLIYKYLCSVENRTLKRVDKVRVCSSSMKEAIEKRTHIDPQVFEKIFFLPNWLHSDLDRISEIKPNEHTNHEKNTIVYSGNIGMGQGVEDIINVASELPDYHFIIRGEGIGKAKVIEEVQRKALKNIEVSGFVPIDDYYRELLSENIVPIITVKKGVGLYSVPSKALNMIKAKKPAIYVVDKDSELANTIEKYNFGIQINPGDKSSLKLAVVEAFNKENRGSFDELNRNLDRERILSEYSRRILDVASTLEESD